MIPPREVTIEAEGASLKGILARPARARSIVLFAHGSGSGRNSPRNQFVAEILNQAGLATLLLDLLQEEETFDRRNVFDIELLAHRLVLATDWLERDPRLKDLNVGYFGASTGAAAALAAAAQRAERVNAVVSRGGRPDLALPHLAAVKAPTLLLVGGADLHVIPLNRLALAELKCEKDMVIVPGASHLFEESGTLEIVAERAAQWFTNHLTPSAEASEGRPPTPRQQAPGPSVNR